MYVFVILLFLLQDNVSLKGTERFSDVVTRYRVGNSRKSICLLCIVSTNLNSFIRIRYFTSWKYLSPSESMMRSWRNSSDCSSKWSSLYRWADPSLLPKNKGCMQLPFMSLFPPGENVGKCLLNLLECLFIIIRRWRRYFKQDVRTPESNCQEFLLINVVPWQIAFTTQKTPACTAISRVLL